MKVIKNWERKARNGKQIHLFTYFASDLCVGNSCAAAEITELPIVINTAENVLWLNISVNDWWLLHMHLDKTLDDMRGN